VRLHDLRATQGTSAATSLGSPSARSQPTTVPICNQCLHRSTASVGNTAAMSSRRPCCSPTAEQHWAVPKITLIGGCINDGVAALLDVPYPLKLYLLYFLRTQTERLRGVNQGAAQPNLNTTIIKSIDVSIPPVSEQTRIVAEVERRLSVVEELEAVVKPTTARPSKNLASGPECWG